LAAKGSFVANVSLAHAYDPTKTNVEGWLLSEKLDGMRCLWHNGALWSRNGNKIHAPAYVLECLPRDLDLDGELFLGRGKFQECMSIVRRQDEPETWKRIRYVIFDAPTVAGGISKRLDAARAALARLKDGGKPHAEVLEQRICRGVEHVKQELRKVEALKGEGLMLRHPTAEHRGGRTSDLLKVKSFFDAEAVVLAHIEGTGKNKGRMGALECRNKAGKVFRLGTGFSEKDRETPPLVGSVVTFGYTELTTAGIPRFPVFLRVRPDMDASDFQ
jgi:DNA ligase-1